MPGSFAFAVRISKYFFQKPLCVCGESLQELNGLDRNRMNGLGTQRGQKEIFLDIDLLLN